MQKPVVLVVSLYISYFIVIPLACILYSEQISAFDNNIRIICNFCIAACVLEGIGNRNL